MANWTTAPQPFGDNRAPLLEGLSSVDGATPVPVAVDPATGAVATTSTVSGNVNVITQVGVANIATGQQTLSTSSSQVVGSRPTRRSVTIVNLSSIDVYLGNTGVTSSTGQLLLGTKGTAITIETTTAVFAIAVSATPTVSYLEEYA